MIPSQEGATAAEPNPSTPEIIGRYALFPPFASGGMATVHVGRLVGPAGFTRTVAIKRLHAQYARNAEFVAMFLDEARLAARLQHPNVVSTIDIVTLDGELLLVMEYVAGGSLGMLWKKLRREGEHIPLEIIGSIMTNALDGLHAAHEAMTDGGVPLGIVHRDVSPQNILVGENGVARIIDFGIAKAAVRLGTTKEGQLKGKLNYMAPEQIVGESLDRRADVFGAGAVLWEMLTMRRLYDGPDHAVMFEKLNDEALEPPSKYAPRLPNAVDELALRALATLPADRFATAGEMSQAVEEALGIVSPRRVAGWLRDALGDQLEERSRIVQEIESLSSSGDISLPPELRTTPDGATIGRANSYTDEPKTRISGTNQPLPLRPRISAPIAVGALCVGGLAALLVASPGDEKPVNQAGSDVPTEPTPAVSVPAPPAVSAAPTSSTSTPSTSTSSNSTSSNKAVVTTVQLTVPQDAKVLVDGKPVAVQDGVVDVSGALGSVHRVRVVSGGRRVDREVVITESGARPPEIAVASRGPRAAPAKPGPTATPAPAPAPKGKGSLGFDKKFE